MIRKEVAKPVWSVKTLTANGTPIKDIAQMRGISRTTVYHYLEKLK